MKLKTVQELWADWSTSGVFDGEPAWEVMREELLAVNAAEIRAAVEQRDERWMLALSHSDAFELPVALKKDDIEGCCRTLARAAVEQAVERERERRLRVERIAACALLQANHGEYSNGVLGPAGEDEGAIRGGEALTNLNAEAKAVGLYEGSTFYDIEQHYAAAIRKGSQ